MNYGRTSRKRPSKIQRLSGRFREVVAYKNRSTEKKNWNKLRTIFLFHPMYIPKHSAWHLSQMVLYLFEQNKPQLRRNLVPLSFHHVFVWWRIFRTNLDGRRTRHPGLEERYSHPHTSGWWYLRYSNLLLKYTCTQIGRIDLFHDTRHLCIVDQQLPALLDVTCFARLHILLHVFACRWELLRNVRNR